MSDSKETIVGKLKFNKKTDIIGRSRGTIIYKGKYEDHIDVAIKRIQKDDDIEIKILRDAHTHPNIVTYYTTEDDEDFHYIATELCQGTLEDLVKDKYEGEDVGSKLKILKQIAEGLNHLHSKEIVHRDIKPQNILISRRNGSVPPMIKLTDFGISRKNSAEKSDLTKTGSAGTLGWIAPEFYNPAVERYSQQSDIFPLGCVFSYVLSDGKHPFGDEKDFRQGNIKKGEYKLSEKIMETNKYAVELIVAMLDPNPDKRPTIQKVLEHRLFDGVRNNGNGASSKTNSVTFGKYQELSLLFDEHLKKAESILGRGSFNTIVCKVQYNGKDRAIKRIEKEYNENYVNEIEILSGDDLKTENVVRYFHNEENNMYCYIIMELCDLSLSQCIDDRKIEFEIYNRNLLLKQIVSGLECVHRIDIVHRDLKPSNVLVIFPRPATDNKYVFKLADFGISKKLDIGEKDVTEKRRGSTGWMAPELFATPAEYTKAVDIFASALILFYATTGGNHPFAPENSTSAEVGSKLKFDACQENIKKDKLIKLKIIEKEHPEMHDLVHWMIQPKPIDRPSIDKVLKHPYFWLAEEALNFIRKVSEKIEVDNKKETPMNPFLRLLEKEKDSIFTSDCWRKSLTEKILKNLDYKREKYPYNGNSVGDLLRAIRNKYAHYHTLTYEERKEFGIVPEEYWNYWIVRFPNLLIITWRKWNDWNGSLSEAEVDEPATGDLIENKETEITQVHEDRSELEFSSSPSSDESYILTSFQVHDLATSLGAIALEPNKSETSETTVPLPVWNIAWNPIENQLLAAVSLDSVTSLWDTSTVPPKNTTLRSPENRANVSRKSHLTVAWKNDGKVIVTGNSVGDLVFWKLDGTQLLFLPSVMESFVLRLEFHPIHNYLLGTTSNKIAIWMKDLDDRPMEWKGMFEKITYASFNELDPYVAVCGSSPTDGFAINVISLTYNMIRLLHAIPSAHDGKINEAKWQRGGGKHLATGSVDHSVKIWLSGKLVHYLKKHQSPVTTIEWRPTELQYLASASVDGTIFIWNTSNGTCVHSLERVHEQTIKTLAFPPDGNMLASGGYDNKINVWNFQTTDRLQQIQSTNTGCRINKLCWNCGACCKLGAALNDGTVSFYLF